MDDMRNIIIHIIQHVCICTFLCVTQQPINETEGVNVLFNNALNTFYLWLYGKVKFVLFNDATGTH